MNQFIVRKIIEGNFKFSKLNFYLSDDDIEKGVGKLNKNFKLITKGWDIQKNSQWVLRNYLAAKMIMSSTVLITSLKFGKERNLNVAEPYLIYYALLNVARAIVFTSPIAQWKNGELLNSTHLKILNIVGDAIGQFNKEIGDSVKDLLARAKDYRELFSYKFPANGISDFTVDYKEAIDICSFMAEFAQFQSEILEKQNFSKENIVEELDIEILKPGFIYKGKKYEYLDNEDWYRLEYIIRKQPFPVNLYFTLSEGMVEDFFGAWYDYNNENDDGNKDLYNPDIDCNIIFPMP
jgi:hypothetical protein